MGALPGPNGAWAVALPLLFALYYVAPGVPLSLLLLALCAAACLARLPLAVSLVPLAMPFYMLPKNLGGPNRQFSLGETAIVLCAIAFALVQGRALLTSRGVRRRVLHRLAHPTGLDLAVALFLLAATAATLDAHRGVLQHLALRQYRVAILEPVAYYVLAASTLRDARAMLRSLWAAAGAGLLVALLGLGQYFFRPATLTGTVWVGDTPHPVHFVSAVYGSPDNVGLLLDRAIPVAVVLGLLLLSARRTDRAWLSFVPWLALLPMAAALLLSNSRGGIVVAVAAAVGAVLLWRLAAGRGVGRRARGGALALGGAAVVLAVAGLVLLTVYHPNTGSRRLLVWKSALAMIRDHPLLGVGPDNFMYYYFDPRIAIDPRAPSTDCLPGLPTSLNVVKSLPKHYMDPRAWQEPCLSHPHNIALDLWLSTGLVGLVAFAAVLVVAGRYALRTLRALGGNIAAVGDSGRRATLRAVQVGAVVVVGATLAHGLVDNSVFLPDLAVLFWLAVALTNNLRPLAAV